MFLDNSSSWNELNVPQYVHNQDNSTSSPGLLGWRCINLQLFFTFDVIGWLIAKFFQIWSREAGYGELLMHALLANKKRRNILNE